MQKRGTLRQGFTLIEYTAALAVFAIIALMWRPILQSAEGLRTHDETMVQAMVANRGLEEKAAGGYVRIKELTKEVLVNSVKKKVVDRRLVIVKTGAPSYEVGFFDSATNGKLVRVTTGSGGYMPLFMKVTQFKLNEIAKGTVRYTVFFADGQQFSGVLDSDVEQTTTK